MKSESVNIVSRGGVLVNKYSIFWIKEEVAQRYFYKSDILYRFLKSYQSNKGRQDLSKQYNYITHNFPEEALIEHIKKNNHSISIKTLSDKQKMTLYKNNQYILLYVYDSHLTFLSKSLHEAEYLLFPILRTFHPLLFIMSHTHINYGWISPVPNIKYKNRQVL